MAQNSALGADQGIGAWFIFGGAMPNGVNLIPGSDYSIAARAPSNFKPGVELFDPYQISCRDMIGETLVAISA